MANIINKKVVNIDEINYTYTSLDASIDFVCDKCLKPKVVKKFAEYTDKNGEIKRICNACYSNACQGK